MSLPLASHEREPAMEPVIAVLLRRFELQLAQLDSRIRVEASPLRHVYRLDDQVLAVLHLHRDLFRLETGSEPSWEARIRSPEEALAGLARVLDHYWRLLAGPGARREA
ncbi:hypothetical protein FJ251_05515 [bacterium]|nr:hypothetical protein [bacterium]